MLKNRFDLHIIVASLINFTATYRPNEREREKNELTKVLTNLRIVRDRFVLQNNSQINR